MINSYKNTKVKSLSRHWLAAAVFNTAYLTSVGIAFTAVLVAGLHLLEG